MKSSEVISNYQIVDEKHSRYRFISKLFTFSWNNAFNNAQTNIIHYKKTIGSDIKDMVLARRKAAKMPQVNERDIPEVCERFMSNYGILERYCPSTVSHTKSMLRNVSIIVAGIFRVPVSALKESHFLNDVALQVFVEYISASPKYDTLRPMAKRFYTYLFYEQVGEASQYDPKYVEICNTVDSIGKGAKNKRTEKKMKARQVKDHPLLQEYAEHRRERTKERKVREVYSVRKFYKWYCNMHDISYEKEIADIDLYKISSRDIEQFVEHLMSLTKLDEKDVGQIKVETASLNLRHIRRFFKYLVQRGHIRKSPVDNIEPIETTRKRNYRYATQEQCEDFLETVHRLSKGPVTDMSMFQLAMYLGMRPSEVVNLKVRSFDFENGRIKFLRAKSNKVSDLELPSFLIAWLTNYMKTHPEPENPEAPMFYNSKKRPMTYGTYRRRYHKFRENMRDPISEEMKGPHVFRHTFATMLIKNKARLDKVSEVLGHTSIRHTDAYLHSGKLGVGNAVEEYIDILTKGDKTSDGN